MSLQVWLPLTKDLRQQGLDNITVTTANTNNFQNEGKLSNKSLDVSGHYAFRVPSLVKKRVFSCAFWYKPITDSSLSDNWRRIVVFDTYTSDGSTTGALFRFESSYGYQSSNTTYCISIHNNAGEPIASIGTGLGETNGWNKWQHIAITADGTTLKCYRNGVQVASGNMGNGGMLQGTVHIGYSGNRPVGRLNDFRIYDHCLSPMEVKELAKGIVLHYPLADAYVEAGQNLSGGDIDNTCYNATTSKYNYGTNTDIYKETGTFQGRECTKVHMGTAGQTCYPYVHFSSLTAAAGGTRTLSFDYYPTKMDKITFYTHGTSGTTIWSSGSTKGTTTGTATIPVTLNHWNHIRISITNTGTSTSGWGYMTIGNTNHTSTTTDYWLFDNVMIVEGTVEKPFNLGTRAASGITYDCSGFCNNGTNMGTVSISEDTPKYRYSIQLTGTTVDTTSNTKTGAAYITGPCSLSNITALTVSWWAKIKQYGRGGIMDLTAVTSNYEEGTDYNTCPLSNWDSTFRLWDGTNAFNFFSYVLKDSTWHHYVITFTSGSGKFYRDGVNVANSGTMGNTLTNFNGIRTGLGKAGGVYRQIKEDISDIRIYATALSADDVKSLYQNSAYIDSSGNIYGAVHTEV